MVGVASSSVVFVGELTVDLIADDIASLGTERHRSFERMAMPPEDWAVYVSQATSNRRVEAYAGGSVANVAAAFAAGSSNARMRFICVAQPTSARLRSPLWWRGYNKSAADLRARSISVLGYDIAPRKPETPGALAFVDSTGKVTRLLVNAQEPRVPIEQPGELLIIRSDHIRLLRREYLESFSSISVLLADDGLGWEEAINLPSNGKAGWVFGTVQQIDAVAPDFQQNRFDRLWLVGTEGSRPCLALEVLSHERTLLQVPALTQQIESDLGAGDAYMGGFLALALCGGSLIDSHRSGCAAAVNALCHRGARADAPENLNMVFPPIGRISSRRDEGQIFHRIRCSPGLTVVSGGQTGVETTSAKEAIKFGLPVHLVMPKGLRRENGCWTVDDARRLGRVRIHELGSESFRYRTWATVYAADAILLLDHANGEGSEETRRAAQYLDRPLLDVGRKALTYHEVALWLEHRAARVVLIAGSRASLLAKTGSTRILRRQIQSVVRGICLANQCLLGAEMEASLPRFSGRLGAPKSLIESGVLSELLPNLTPTEIVTLPPRDLATAFAVGELTTVVTWPSLLPKSALRFAKITPLGAFTVHYGFSFPTEHPRNGDRLAIQYIEALEKNVPSAELAWSKTFRITGQAEEWLRHGLADAAYDTLRSGATIEAFGLGNYFPSHWESISLVWRENVGG